MLSPLLIILMYVFLSIDIIIQSLIMIVVWGVGCRWPHDAAVGLCMHLSPRGFDGEVERAHFWVSERVVE